MVYVRWYGKVLQGELLDGEYLGMKQVRIPLDGVRPVALFAPEHIYDTADCVGETTLAIEPQGTLEPAGDVAGTVVEAEGPVKMFVRDNWDETHQCVRVDKLEEFYQLWRSVHTSTYTYPDYPVEQQTIPVIKEVKKQQKVALSLFDLWEQES